MSYQDFKRKRLENEVKSLKTKLVMQTAQRIKDLDDAYPDVGWGMSWDTAVSQAMKSLGYRKDEVDI